MGGTVQPLAHTPVGRSTLQERKERERGRRWRRQQRERELEERGVWRREQRERRNSSEGEREETVERVGE